MKKITTQSQTRLRIASRLTLVALVLGLSACATVTNPNPKDPWESYNRPMHNFNSGLDDKLLKPVAQGYADFVPAPLREMVSNVFSNVGDVYSSVNNLLQGKPVRALEDFMRVAINTGLGLGGILDIATPGGLPKYKEDFGQTLGVWGVPSGPYLVLPLFGPSSARDGVGFVVDRAMSPISYLSPLALSAGVSSLAFVDTRANLLGATNLLGDIAFDQYSFVRDGYLQRRNYLVYDGDPPDEDEKPVSDKK